MEHNQLPDILTVEEAAAFLRVSRWATYEAIRARQIPHIKIGRLIRIPKAALVKMLDDPLQPVD